MKYKLIASVFLLMVSVFALNSCASAKKTGEDVQKKEDKSKKKGKQNFVGWIDGSQNPISFEKGIVRLRAIPALGSFNVSVVNSRGKAVPVLLSGNEYVSTSFYLNTDKRLYKLAAGSGIRSSAKLREDGIEIIYSIKNLADINLLLTCFSSTENSEVDMVKITADVKNISTRNEKFALKVIFDTILGESDRYHFYLPDGTAVKNEAQFPSSGSAIIPWIISKNEKAAVQFLFYGADITKPEYVYAANYSTLDTQNWYPNLLTYRSFDTVYAYNNSALGINWISVNLKPEDKASYVTYMALAADDSTPKGQYYIHPETFIEEPEPEPDIEVLAELINSEPEEVEETPVPVAEETPPVQPQPRVREKKEPAPVPPEDVPNVKFDVLSLSKEQLEPEYIQNLINRITVLEASGQSVNRAELLQLNAELDAILEILRQN